MSFRILSLLRLHALLQYPISLLTLLNKMVFKTVGFKIDTVA